MDDKLNATTEPSDKRSTQEIEVVPHFVVEDDDFMLGGVWFDNVKDFSRFVEEHLEMCAEDYKGYPIDESGSAECTFTIAIHMKPKGYAGSLPEWEP